MNSDKLKEELLAFCKDFVHSRLYRINTNIEETQKALTSETKSSAGDKHETGRAMIQLEREKLGQQLAEAEKMKPVLSRINISIKPTVIGLGSLVFTSKEIYFLGISAGEYKNYTSRIFCISAATPIGRLLTGKKEGESFTFNNETILIKKFH